MLTGNLSLGLQAVLLAYVVPLVLLVAVLFVSIDALGSEPGAALAAIATLAIYYGVLYFVRDKLARKFSFTIKHITYCKLNHHHESITVSFNIKNIMLVADIIRGREIDLYF